MFVQLTRRIWATTDKRLLWKFCWNFGVKSAIGMQKFKSRLKRGEFFPAFLYISVINSCNLRCQGCWVDVDGPREMIDLDLMNRVINDAKQHGSSFFGILGGEPFLHPQLLDILGAHPDCYFQVFTNGQMITEKVAAELRRLGNVTPLVSIEGKEAVSDERRGGKDVYRRTLRGLENCLEARLLTGVATSLCRTNIDELLTEDWLRELIRRGVHYAWYYAYRPIGPQMCSDLALTPEQQLRARRFVVEMRAKLPIAIVDAYYDHDGRALCPMATGISHHVSPRGEIEPCPVIQFAKENIRDGASIYSVMRNSEFLKDFRRVAAQATRGCVVLERADLIRDLVRKHGARDSTIRQTAMAELDQMQPRFSQWLPGHEVPEKHWMYRWAKRLFFHDFGAYGPAPLDMAAKVEALKKPLDQVSSSKDTSAVSVS
ncbi:MAG: radical SAM protein [Verrucomicrobia bacterium]|nr:radical SAM protein [Verrucomicrobiota bacterium]